MRKTYGGSCHCGAVRFDCTLDLLLRDGRLRDFAPWRRAENA